MPWPQFRRLSLQPISTVGMTSGRNVGVARPGPSGQFAVVSRVARPGEQPEPVLLPVRSHGPVAPEGLLVVQASSPVQDEAHHLRVGVERTQGVEIVVS